jgi:hypothetical protein
LVRVIQGPSSVVFRGGGGSDRIFADSSGVRLTLFGEGGDDWLQGNSVPAIDTIDGGPGDDLLDPGFDDDVHGGSGFDTARMDPGGVTASVDDAANDGVAGARRGRR